MIVSDTVTTGNSGSIRFAHDRYVRHSSSAVAAALGKWRTENPRYRHLQYRPAHHPDPQTGKSEPNFAYGYVAEAISVEVDIETGHAPAQRDCRRRCGPCDQPQQLQGQIEAAVVQAMGHV
jgi:CO/xanthine dehydrogenase Mo-binding subunit